MGGIDPNDGVLTPRGGPIEPVGSRDAVAQDQDWL
jgi:hypothetical protein